jgi:hypothetical protein
MHEIFFGPQALSLWVAGCQARDQRALLVLKNLCSYLKIMHRFDWTFIERPHSPFEDNSEVPEGWPKNSQYYLAHRVVLKELHKPRGSGFDDCGSYWLSRSTDCYYDPTKEAFLDLKTDEYVTNSAEAAQRAPRFDTLSQLKKYVGAGGSRRRRNR